MILVLYLIGSITFVISIIVGFLTGSFLGFLVSILAGISSAITLFALGKILENQEYVSFKLEFYDRLLTELQGQEKIICSKCGYEYENDYTSCPHCGYKE